MRDNELNDKYNIFIDECGFGLHLRKGCGRSKAGERVRITIPTIRGRNITLLAAINCEEVFHFKIFTGSCNSEIFIEFIAELKEKILGTVDSEKYCIIMDNARAHCSNLTFKHKYLSPYSYMLNPIEFLFSKIKAIVRMELENIIDLPLGDVISSALSYVRIDDLMGWYRLVRRNCNLAINIVDF